MAIISTLQVTDTCTSIVNINNVVVTMPHMFAGSLEVDIASSTGEHMSCSSAMAITVVLRQISLFCLTAKDKKSNVMEGQFKGPFFPPLKARSFPFQEIQVKAPGHWTSSG
jgi:hypothetical protein